MFIALALAFCLGSLATFFVLIAPAMLSSKISREEELKEIVVNRQLTFANQIILDAEFEETAPPSSGIVRVAPHSPLHVSQASAAGHRKVDLYA